jgi:hypothetical protein
MENWKESDGRKKEENQRKSRRFKFCIPPELRTQQEENTKINVDADGEYYLRPLMWL